MSKNRSRDPHDVHLDDAVMKQAEISRDFLQGLGAINTKVESWGYGSAILVRLEKEDQTILLDLRRCYPTAKQQVLIEQDTGIPHKKLSERVEYLLDHKLIERPFGPRKGIVISEFGLKHLLNAER